MVVLGAPLMPSGARMYAPVVSLSFRSAPMVLEFMAHTALPR